MNVPFGLFSKAIKICKNRDINIKIVINMDNYIELFTPFSKPVFESCYSTA